MKTRTRVTRMLAAACLLGAACAAKARVGESVAQSETRYGGAGEE